MVFSSLAPITDAFVTAALDSSQWSAALDAISRATNSTGACLVPVHGRIPYTYRSESLAEVHRKYVQDGWIHRDERYRAVPFCRRVGAASDLNFATVEEVDRHPYWQEFLRPLGYKWFGAVMIGFGDDFWVVSIQRSPNQGPFLREEILQLAQFSPNLSSAGALVRALDFARIESALAAFEASDTGILLFDRMGNVTNLNNIAEKILCSEVTVRGKRLCSYDPSVTHQIDRALLDAVWSPDKNFRAVIKLPRRCERPLMGYLSRAPKLFSDALMPCHAVMVLQDPSRKMEPEEGVLQLGLGLTTTESRVACLLVKGEHLHQVADNLNMSYETVRTHLKRIFHKANVTSQAELVALGMKMKPLL